MNGDDGRLIDYFALVTDFGCNGPYLGQLHAVLRRQAARVPVIDLLSDAPCVNPRAAAYLLAALSRQMPDNALFIAVVDPGVGGERAGIILETARHCFVGPDNGLLSRVAHHAADCRAWRIDWTPATLSASFHGRDLFAPVAARLANGEPFPRRPLAPDALVGSDWPADLPECIYIDHYGNVYTGIRGDRIDRRSVIRIGKRRIRFAATFSDVSPGELFWYVNSCGLIEIAANLGRASALLGTRVGDPLSLDPGDE